MAQESSYMIIIFGASGDLTWRKLIPALYNNFKKDRLQECSHIVGFSRRPFSDEEFRLKLQQGVMDFSPDSYEAGAWLAFSEKISYIQGNLTVLEDYQRLEEQLALLEGGAANRLYYLATSPEYYGDVSEHLGAAGMADQNDGWRRIVIEKPFGTDLLSSQELNLRVHKVFSEDQVYRIDHFLGKETAQNILFFRFANTIFEPIWNRRYVDNIQISVLESVDVAHRGGYYDKAGILRDMFQNHLLQLLTLVGMEAPSSFNADSVRNEKIQVLESIRPIETSDAVAGQYLGYAQTEGVPADTATATFAAIKLFIDNWRWQGVPFYLRSGKALKNKTSEIIIEFQKPPHLMFSIPDASKFRSNILCLSIQPDEGIHLQFQAKLPDSEQEMIPVDMDFHYGEEFNEVLPDAYERLLLEAIQGDASLFTRADMIEAAWRLMDPIIHKWKSLKQQEVPLYQQGSWGPEQADQLLTRDKRSWRLGNELVHEKAR